MTSGQLGDYLSGRKEPGARILARMAEEGLDVQWYLTGRSGPTAAVPGAEGEPPTRYTRSQLGNFRMLDDGGLLDEPVYSGPEGMAMLIAFKKLQALRKREDELRDERDAAMQVIAGALGLPPGNT